MGHTDAATITIYRLHHLCVRTPVVQSLSVTHQSESASLTHLITPHYTLLTTRPQQPIGNLTTIYVLSAYLTSANTWHRGEDLVPIFCTRLLISCQCKIISWCSRSSAAIMGGQQERLRVGFGKFGSCPKAFQGCPMRDPIHQSDFSPFPH